MESMDLKLMEQLLDYFEEDIQKLGYQCIRVRNFEDFYMKLNCMGGSYKGFVIVHSLNDIGLIYIDTDEIKREAIKRSRSGSLPDISYRICDEFKYMNSIREGCVNVLAEEMEHERKEKDFSGKGFGRSGLSPRMLWSRIFGLFDANNMPKA